MYALRRRDFAAILGMTQPLFERMNRKLEEDIAVLENQIAEAGMQQATLAQLWEVLEVSADQYLIGLDGGQS